MAIQILRDKTSVDPTTRDVILKPGQPFYSGYNKQLYVGDGVTNLSDRVIDDNDETNWNISGNTISVVVPIDSIPDETYVWYAQEDSTDIKETVFSGRFSADGNVYWNGNTLVMSNANTDLKPSFRCIFNGISPTGAAWIQPSGEHSAQAVDSTTKKNQTSGSYNPLDDMYDPSKRSFDIGCVLANRLNPGAGATGTACFAYGLGLQASGYHNAVFGRRNCSDGYGVIVAGQGNFANGSDGSVFGAVNLMNGSYYSFISGYQNSIDDASDVADKTNSTVVLGMSNKVKNSQRSFIAGQSNEIDRAQRNIVLGKSNKLTGTKMNNDNIMIGESNTITDVNSVIVLGRHNSVTKAGATLVGTGLLPSASAANPVVIGSYNIQDNNYPFIIGVGSSSTRYSAIMIPSGSDLSSKIRRILLNGDTQIFGDLMVSTFSVNSNKLRIKDSKIESELPMDLAAKFTLTGAMTSTQDVLFYKNHGTWSNKINFNDGTLKVFADAAVGDSDATTITRKSITTPKVTATDFIGLASKATADAYGNNISDTYLSKVSARDIYLDMNAASTIYATKTELEQTETDCKEYADTELAKKADKATTLSGYGITNAYTKSEVNTELNKKANSSEFSSTFDFLTIVDGKLAFEVRSSTFTAGNSFKVNEPYYNPVDVAFWKLVVPNSYLTIKSISGTSIGSTVTLKNSDNQEFSGTVTSYNGNIPEIRFTCKIQ